MENCKGCHTEVECSLTLTHVKQMRVDCPCGVCLIKVICNSSCDEYEMFWGGEGVYVLSHMNANKGNAI